MAFPSKMAHDYKKYYVRVTLVASHPRRRVIRKGWNEARYLGNLPVCVIGHGQVIRSSRAVAEVHFFDGDEIIEILRLNLLVRRDREPNYDGTAGGRSDSEVVNKAPELGTSD